MAHTPQDETGKPAWVLPFLEELRKNGIIASGCKVANISRETVRLRRQSDKGFDEDVKEAFLEAADYLVAKARTRAMSDVPDTRSDTLLMFLIKKYDPTFREHYVAELTGPGGKDLPAPVLMLPPIAKGDE